MVESDFDDEPFAAKTAPTVLATFEGGPLRSGRPYVAEHRDVRERRGPIEPTPSFKIESELFYGSASNLSSNTLPITPLV